MRSSRLKISTFFEAGVVPVMIAGWLGLAGGVSAQPANDNWAAAQVITGTWGSVTNDNTDATAEPGEPNHAGSPATSSIWYRWVAPTDGEVTLDTIGSGDLFPLDTVLAVYSGTNLTTLRQVAANDDMFPFLQYNTSSPQNFPGFTLFPRTIFQGPSVLRFNATAGTTYFIAADTKFFATGAIQVNWAFHPAGVFRFATEDFDDFATGLPMFQVSEAEAFGGEDSTIATYYSYNAPGALVTVTRVAGSSGRMLVDYATVDDTAFAFEDYIPVTGTLVFDDFEMSKTILVQMFPFGTNGFGLPGSNRDFFITLANPRQAPDDQSPNVSIPRVDPVMGVAKIQILDTDIDPILVRNLDTNGMFIGPSNSVFNFEKVNYRLPEDVNDYYTTAGIWVFRSGTNGESVTLNYRINNFRNNNRDPDEENNNYFPLQAGSDYATPEPPSTQLIHGTNADFVLAQGTLQWGGNDFTAKRISFTIPNDQLTEFNEDFHVFLFRIVNNAAISVGTVNEACVTILFDDKDPPAGSVDEFHNADFGVDMAPPVATTPAQISNPGADGVIYSLASQADGRTIVAGNFFSYNTIPRRCIARMGTDGMIDPSFNPGGGANDFISSLVLTTNGQILIGGGFTSFNSVQRNGIARLDLNGTLDTTFTPGLGADLPVWATLVQSDGKALIAGEFTTFNATNRLHIARLNITGSLDTSFDPGTNGPNGTIWAMALQPDGKVIIAGEFTSIGGLPRNGIARLNANGSLDTSFDPGTGADGIIYTVALRQDGRIWVGGEFSFIDSVPLKRFARLNGNGSVDLTFDPGTGADDTVYSIGLQPNGSAYVGGQFTSFNGTHRMGFTRLFDDGTVDTGFLDPAYNQFAGLHKARFTDPSGIVFTSSVQPDGNVLIGGNFLQVGGGQAEAKVRFDANYPTNTFNRDVWTEKKARNGLRNRSNVARLIGGSTPGPGNIGLLYDSYPVGENQSFVFVGLVRNNGTLGYSSANFAVQPGLAQSGIDYIYNGAPPLYLSSWEAYDQNFLSSTPAASTRMHSDGLFGTNAVPTDLYGDFWFNYTPGQVTVSVINDNLIQGDRSTQFQLANPSMADLFFLGGEDIPVASALGRSKAPFTITDDDHRSGTLGFAQPNFTVNENAGSATITILRTNGSFGSVTVQYTTADGTGLAGLDYQFRSGSITFGNGQTTKTFSVPIINNSVVQPVDRTVNLRLSGLGGGASLGLSNAVLNIVDDDFPPGFINFSSATFATNESAGAVILTLNRSGGSRGTITVQCGTTNGSALAGINYVATTNTVQWNDLDSAPKTVTIPLIHDGVVGTNKTFQAVLFNAKVNTTNSPIVLSGSPTKTTVTMIEDDRYGNLQFSAGSYQVNENGGFATITVIRTGGASDALHVQFATADAGAVSSGPLPNYVATNGLLTFNPGEVSKSFTVTLLDDGVFDPPLNNFFFTVNLSGLTPAGAVFGSPTTVPVYILDAEGYNQPAGSLDTAFSPTPGMNGEVFSVGIQPDGKIIAAGNFTLVNNFSRNRIARLNPDSTLDSTFLAGLSGINGTVRTLLLQSNGRVLVGGAFTSINNINRNRMARLNGDGSVDTSFNPGSGADDLVLAQAETFGPEGRQIMIGGSFTTISGITRPGLARLNDDGTVDGSFNPGLSLNGAVFAIAIYPTNSLQQGKILIGGDFTQVNGFGRNRIARLNADGSLDTSFDPGTGASDVVRALAIQLDNRIVLGGAFTNFNGQPLNRIARVNSDGSLDGSFAVGEGANDTVSAIVLQPDNRIVLAGQFSLASGVTRGRITRLLADGTVDPSINFGTGANSFINTLALQGDGMFVLGGGFTEYDGVPRQRIARIYGGSLSGQGGFEFGAADFQVDEMATNALITVRRRGGTSGNVSVNFATTNGSAIAGINFSNVNLSLLFPTGETLRTVNVPVRDDLQITPDLVANLSLSGAPLGNQPTATLTIINDDSSISFSSPSYSRAENATDGAATIHILRQGSVRGAAVVDFLTTTNGTALPTTNYLPVATTLTFQPGDTDLIVKVPVLHDLRAQGDKTVVMALTNASNALLFNPSVSTLTIIDVEHAPGQLGFSVATNSVNEAAGSLPVTIIRTNGSLGVVTVNFATLPGTALPGLKYLPTNGVVTFADGEVSKPLSVPILNTTQVEGNQTFSLILSNATGGATLGVASEFVTIVDDDTGLNFSSPVYVTSENSVVSLTVFRPNGTNAVTTVNYFTTNGTAIAGSNYVATSGTLVFTNGETIKSFSLATLRDPRVTGDLNFTVGLSNPSSPAQLVFPSVATVTILDSDSGLSFTNAEFPALKSGTNVLITVARSNANTGLVFVNYATSNGTAQAGVDYVPTSGLLTFSNGIALQTFSVPIINNRLAQGDRTFTINLLNPTAPAQLIPPSTATVTITDDISGISLSAPAYSINENGGAANITVVRSGYLSNTVSVGFTTTNGSALENVNYVSAHGVLVFTNGETIKTFGVPVIDNGVVDGDKTALILLTNISGNAVLVNPSSATLSIREADGSLIVSAGSSLVFESGPANGAIDPGEQVTLLFGLRNASGTNTASLVATLLSTNGVTLPSGPQNYGALVSHGPSVSRPFTFTASGTNGQALAATFQLQDGARNLGVVVFNFNLGKSTNSFANPGLIVIRDNNSALPYPSTVSVNGMGGTVSKVTVTVTNLNHTAPLDIDALLVSPTGQKQLLLAKAGGNHAINNVTLTFDDAAASQLPQSTQIVSGTYRPTSYAVAAPPFPVPAPPPPYGNTLAGFNGATPNGIWSLYIMDDTFLDSGAVSNGWILNLTTIAPVPGNADAGLTMVASSPSVVATSNLVYTLTLVNYGPGTATNLVVSDLLPAGVSYVSSFPSLGVVTTNGAGLVTWTIGSMAKDASATLALTVRPGAAGTVINTATVASASVDINPDDDSASVSVSVLPPSADLALGLNATPNPVALGGNVTYTLTVSNLGPATATGVSATNTLPGSLSFLTAAPAGYVVNGNVVTFTNLGSLGSGAQVSVTIVARTLVADTITNVATCSSTVGDPLKANNTASVKVVVEGPSLSVSQNGSLVTVSWPADASNYVLESADSLQAPVIWTPVTTPPSQLAGNQKTVTIGSTNSSRFFRLHATP
ncbi:MAG TPA: Calx-beta domain-containing protein [Methylomirabilota bacterium]|nr:Calx-beta domain-containing protein [Methylomirabilota bacterium]